MAATPDSASCPVRVTLTASAYQPLASGSGMSAVVVGAVRSIWMPDTVFVVVLPARSVQVAVEERSAPSPVTVSAGGWATTPDSASEQVHVTLIPLRPALAVLPAASTAVPLALWFAPSPRLLAAGQVSTPDSPSAQAKVTVTSPSYQPLAFAGRSGTAAMVGGVLSMLTVAGSVAVLPALSVAVPVTGWPLPSPVTVCGPVQLASPDSASAQENVTVTLPLFQPLTFGGGDWV